MDDTKSLAELRVMLPASLVAELRAKAASEHEQLDTLVLEAVKDYLHDVDETPDEVIFASIREGVRQAQRGDVLPAMETLDTLEREFGDDQD